MFKNTFIRYFIFGLSGALLDFSAFALFYQVFAVGEVVANLIGAFLGFNNNFFLNAFLNFKTKGNLLVRYFSYFIVCAVGMVISSSSLYVCVSLMGFNAFLSKFVIMGGIFLVQYYFNKKITFRKIG